MSCFGEPRGYGSATGAGAYNDVLAIGLRYFVCCHANLPITRTQFKVAIAPFKNRDLLRTYTVTEQSCRAEYFPKVIIRSVTILATIISFLLD